MEGVEPTHPYGYQILSLARLPIPPHRPPDYQRFAREKTGGLDLCHYLCRCSPMHANDAQSRPVGSPTTGLQFPASAHRPSVYHKVLDGRKHPIRGLWKRNGHYYARLNFTDPWQLRNLARWPVAQAR
jgi:hypothetical protein